MAENIQPTPLAGFFGGRDRSDGGSQPRTVVVKKRSAPERDNDAEPESEDDDTGSDTSLATDAPDEEAEDDDSNVMAKAQDDDDETDESGDIDLDQTTDPDALRKAAKGAAARIKRMELSRRKAQSEAGKREQKLREDMKADMDRLYQMVGAQNTTRDSSTAATAGDEPPDIQGEDGDFITVGQAKQLQNRQKEEKRQKQASRDMAKRWLDAEAQELQALPGAKDYLEFAQKEMESDGKLGKLQFSAAKVLHVMSTKHAKDLTAAKDAEYKRGLKDGERKFRKEAEKLGRLPDTSTQRSSVATRGKQQDQVAAKDPNRLVRALAATGAKYGLPPIRVQSKGG